MTEPEAAPAPGRPPDEAKYAAVLAAARRLFMDHGFAKTTIEQVAAAAGVSKVTIYSRFTDKPTLFAAVVRNAVSAMRDNGGGQHDGGSLEQRLIDFGVPLFRFLMSGELIAFHRILTHEVLRAPELARRFFDAGPGFKRAQLTAIIAEAQARGEVAVDDPQRAAEDLLALWKGFHDVEMHLGVAQPMPPEQIEPRIRRGVRLWLRAHGV